MSHQCHAAGCETPVPPHMFMCRKHWRMLPYKMRWSIWTTYRAGQEEDKSPSHEYCVAARKCVQYVASLEGVRGAELHRKLMVYYFFDPGATEGNDHA